MQQYSQREHGVVVHVALDRFETGRERGGTEVLVESNVERREQRAESRSARARRRKLYVLCFMLHAKIYFARRFTWYGIYDYTVVFQVRFYT